MGQHARAVMLTHVFIPGLDGPLCVFVFRRPTDIAVHPETG